MSGEPVADIRALSDLATPWCIRVVVTLKIAERIEGGTDAVEELAAEAECDPEALHRVLSHLVLKGVFEEPTPGRFRLNEAARKLLEPSQQFLSLEGIGGRFAYAWGTLLSAVRTGKPAYHEAFGRPFWEDLDANPEIGASFDALMGPSGHGTPDPNVLPDGNWDGVNTVVDVGGGTGALLAEVLRAHPSLLGTLVDLPRTVQRAMETFASAGVSERVTVAAQSFFDPLPSGADLYILKGVLNDWQDEEAIAILRRCAEAARPSGRIVVLGGVAADASRRGLIGHDQIVVTGLGGKHRNLDRFREIAHEAGLQVTATGPPERFIVECRPV